jgi:hypothetical protein
VDLEITPEPTEEERRAIVEALKAEVSESERRSGSRRTSSESEPDSDPTRR